MNADDIEATRLKHVRVTNNLPFVFSDMYDGVPIVILSGQTKTIPLDMAAHFFGPTFDPAAQLRHIAKRQGWNTPEFVAVNRKGQNKAQEYFEQLVIEPVTYRLVEDKGATDPRAPVPAEQDLQEAEAPVRRGPGRPPRNPAGAAA